MRVLISFLTIAALAQPAELPVRQVVLYKHGVGFFERSGQLAPGESARLEFSATDMDDVLKSLTVNERGGGKVSGLRYDSSLPIERKLAEFPFRLDRDQPLSKALDQLKGARVELKFGAETVAGAIVSGRLASGGEKQPEREQITLLLDAGELRTFDLGAAAGLRFTDAQLQQQFRDYLAALAGARSTNKRGVYIDSTDARAREVSASYMLPMPVWKSSYRLIFEGAQPVLEGWAIVDNTTGEDWTKVQLSLVSGRPISFLSHLYEPKYARREVAELPEDRAQRPVLHEGGYEKAKDSNAPGSGGGIGSGRGGGVGGMIDGATRSMAMLAAPPAPAMFNRAEVQSSSISVDTAARELGDLFEYRIGTPVTIRKNESAMLPFLQEKVQGRKLLIYSSTDSPHPTNAVEVTNSSGKTLDGGPVTVYDAGAYAGEALMETLKGGEKRLISYAVDLGTRVTNAFNPPGEVVREIHARRGIITTRVAAREVEIYTIRNIDKKAKTLIVEHPLRPGFTLLEPKPAEKTSRAYRFEVALGPDSSQALKISEERVYDTTLTISNLSPDLLLSSIRNKSITDAARRQIEQIADRKNQMAAIDRDLQQAADQLRNIASDEERVRRNMESLNNVTGQQQQTQAYARQLGAMETQLAGLRDRQAELQKKRATLDGELNRMIENLTF